MTAADIKEALGLICVTDDAGLENMVSSVYIGDLLSWVMSRAPENCVWITILSHMNVVAVAALAQIGCIIVAEGSTLQADMVEKAKEEKIPVFSSSLTSYELAKELMKIGL